MKIIIPMAGLGKRLGPLTQHKPKALVRLAHKRLLDHILSIFTELEQTHTLEYIFIIGYLGEHIREHMQTAHPEKKVIFYVQQELKGQSHAVLLTKDVVEGPVLLTYCDTLNQIDFSFLNEKNIDAMASVLDVEDPSRHGIAIAGPDNLITKLVEKPKTLEHKSALTGFYYFSEGKDLIKAIETQIQREASLNNEYYLADAINILLENGMRIKAQKALQWLDAGTPDDMLKTNALLLQQSTDLAQQTKVGKSNVLVHPVYIHESARIENSVIGPNVAIGENCSISGSVIKNAIIDDQTTVINAVLNNTLLGRSCTVNGNSLSILAAQQEINISYSTP